MSNGYDDEAGGFRFGSANCGECGQPRYTARGSRERAAFGLSPVTAED